ncbi:MAG: 30S ribosomal protein S6 [Patescibacteria group bacterium]|nr:30S ribosomal protein S6 [Patescibacteria group bacterium]
MEHKNHKEYEINFLVLQSRAELLEKIKEQMKKTIESHKGTITDTLEYRKRKLAYKIDHELYGFYTVFRFTLHDTSVIETLKRDLNLYQNIARYIIVRADELPLLKKKVEQIQEKSVEKKKILKQEDVEKLLAEKKIDQEKKVEKTAVEDNEEIKEDEIKVKKERKVKEMEKEDIDKKEAVEKEIEPKTEESTQEKQIKKEKMKRSTTTKKEGENMLNDLDKKLDEILNI